MAESIAITNVRVFDGQALTEERTVVLANGLISASTTAETSIDGQHGTLLPGFIDSHVHLSNLADLEQGTHWGCTTMLDMGAQAMTTTDALRHRPGLADIRGAGNVASALGGTQISRMGYPTSSAVSGPDDAQRFVAERVSEGADYIKIIVEDPQRMGAGALDSATIAALVEEAHRVGLKAIAHVTALASVTMAAEAGVDILTHAPFDATVASDLAMAIAQRGQVSVPTLIAMQTIASFAASLPTHGPGTDYAHARATVTAFHQAGVPILAGTDAYRGSAAPVSIAHGEALHEELRLLIEAGLTPIEALRAATIVPADYFGFTDRGAIEPGRRADLVLVEGDPTQDIAATRHIRGVWVAGIRVR